MHAPQPQSLDPAHCTAAAIPAPRELPDGIDAGLVSEEMMIFTLNPDAGLSLEVSTPPSQGLVPALRKGGHFDNKLGREWPRRSCQHERASRLAPQR